MMRRTIMTMAAAGVAAALLPSVAFAADALGQVRTSEYRTLQARVCCGWNSWYNNSMTTQVRLPERIGFNFGLVLGKTCCQRDFLKYSESQRRADRIVPGLRADDGTYTSAKIGVRGRWGFEVLLETAVDGDDLVALVSPIGKMADKAILVEPSLPYDGDGIMGRLGGRLVCSRGGVTVDLGTTGEVVDKPYLGATKPRLAVLMPENGGKVGFATGRVRSLEEIERLVADRRRQVEARVAAYGDKAESFQAMQTILAWNTIYDAACNRAITPVSRNWNASNGSGGWVLFDWDTYFAAFMFSTFNKELAFANAVEITKCITPDGFIPNFRNGNGSSLDRSQPPVGSKMVWEIYRRHPEKWFLAEVYDELLSWNRWWPTARDLDGYLCWGSHLWKDGKMVPGKVSDAALESGLDNSPMFDGVPMSKTAPVMLQADVGLMSMYVMDCKALAEIARELGRDADRVELLARAEKYGDKLKTLWCEERGIFMNRRLDTGSFNDVLSPCNFYPLLAGVATKEQAERMMREHYFNPAEFHGTYVMPASARNAIGYKDNTYWRGRIWAPLNLLVYLGMRDYRLDEARKDLVVRSNELLMKNWKATGGIYENYNTDTGVASDRGNSDGFYHWGALLSYLGFLEDEVR